MAIAVAMAVLAVGCGSADDANDAVHPQLADAARRTVGTVIIVTGSVVVRPDELDRAVEVALEHVRRSRTEPGCLLHSVHRDVEDPNRLVFLEKWADRAALDAHFAVPASADFVRRISALAAEPPTIDIDEVVGPVEP